MDSGKLVEIFPDVRSDRVASFQASCSWYSTGVSEPRGADMENETVNVRYMAENVEASMEWYVAHLGFSLISKYSPAFADVQRGAAWGTEPKIFRPGPQVSWSQKLARPSKPRSPGSHRPPRALFRCQSRIARRPWHRRLSPSCVDPRCAYKTCRAQPAEPELQRLYEARTLALNGYELTARRAIDTKALNICDNVPIIDGRGNCGHVILE